MAEITEITCREQIECINRQINFQEEILNTFDTEDARIISDIKHDIACLKAARETLLFDYSLETATVKYKKEAKNVKETFHFETAN